MPLPSDKPSSIDPADTPSQESTGGTVQQNLVMKLIASGVEIPDNLDLDLVSERWQPQPFQINAITDAIRGEIESQLVIGDSSQNPLEFNGFMASDFPSSNTTTEENMSNGTHVNRKSENIYDEAGNEVINRRSNIDLDNSVSSNAFIDRSMSYDGVNNLLSSPVEVQENEVNELITRFSYDSNDNQIITQEPEGNREFSIYDFNDRQIVEPEENNNGWVREYDDVSNLLITEEGIDEQMINKTLIGSSDSDFLSGSNSNELLVGDSGNDTLVGGTADIDQSGYDTLTGGLGADEFRLHDNTSVHYQGNGFAIITDYNPLEQDSITLLDYGINNTNVYSLATGNWSGTVSEDTAIYFQGNLIAVVQDNSDISLASDIDFNSPYISLIIN